MLLLFMFFFVFSIMMFFLSFLTIIITNTLHLFLVDLARFIIFVCLLLLCYEISHCLESLLFPGAPHRGVYGNLQDRGHLVSGDEDLVTVRVPLGEHDPARPLVCLHVAAVLGRRAVLELE